MLPHPQFTKKRVSAPLPIVTLLTAFALATANTANAVRDCRYPEPLLHKSHDSGARIPVFSPLVKPNRLLWRHEWRFLPMGISPSHSPAGLDIGPDSVRATCFVWRIGRLPHTEPIRRRPFFGVALRQWRK